MFKEVVLLGLLTGLLLAAGYTFGGVGGMTIALFLAFLMNFISYWHSDKIILKLYKAKEVTAADSPDLHRIVIKLAREAKIPKPKIYLMNTQNPNAFATGRNPQHAAVAITSSLLNILNHDEIEGVLAHEIGHIKNRDTLISTIAATLAGAIAFLGQIAWWSMFTRDRNNGGAVLFPLIILAPVGASLIRMAISRTREYKADYSGAVFSKKPLSLASVLEKISAINTQHPVHGNPATSHMFIVNPFKSNAFVKMFSTHPPVEERVRRLGQIKV